tara:strand:+ start:181 stop:630 length:450 start_codon:yes stop_codon:yes gene_type:complete
MNYAKKNTIRYLKENLSPKQFRFVRIAPFILAILVLANFIFKNLQYEASKPILQKFDESEGITYYYDKDSNELFTGKASWMLRYNNQKFEGSYKDGRLHGMSKIWHGNGNLAQETIYENGVMISKTSWDKNGIKIIENQSNNRDLNTSE